MMNNPRLEIKKLNADTAELVAALEQECFSNPWSLDSLLSELSNPLSVFYTAFAAGELAGYAGMHHIIDEGYINNIAVAKSFRRQGIASALMEKLEEYAQENGIAMLTLEVRQSNLPAIALYDSFGFRPYGFRRDYYTNPTEDAVIMTKQRRVAAPGRAPGFG